MRNLLACSLLLIGSVVSPLFCRPMKKSLSKKCIGAFPVQNAILTRRYGTVETEEEVVQEEFEAGYGASDT